LYTKYKIHSYPGSGYAIIDISLTSKYRISFTLPYKRRLTIDHVRLTLDCRVSIFLLQVVPHREHSLYQTYGPISAAVTMEVTYSLCKTSVIFIRYFKISPKMSTNQHLLTNCGALHRVDQFTYQFPPRCLSVWVSADTIFRQPQSNCYFLAMDEIILRPYMPSAKRS
jgi:hypothetical protein